eukprot:s3877_g4.t1
MATWRSRRTDSLDALARETLAKDEVSASCCGLAVLRSTPEGFHLNFGLAGLRRVSGPVSVPATEVSFAKEVLHMLCAGDVAQLMPLISDEALKQVSAAKWRAGIEAAAERTATARWLTEPWMVRKENGWIIFRGEIATKQRCLQWICGAHSEQLEFKIAVDPAERRVLGMTYYGHATDAEELPLPSNSPVQPEDCWHCGSITKSMTATLAAVLREKGLLSSEVTVAQALMSDSQLRSVSAKSGFSHVTLEQLLTHRGGAWHEPEPGLWSYAWQLARATKPTCEQRRCYVARMLELEPREIGKYEYSNDGVSLAGVMIETLLDVSWEDLIKRELFLPLRMSSAGFGAAPEIWGTRDGAEAVDPRKPGADNPPATAPAGCVH